jgi:CheY-like chemotaxis protein
MASPFDAPAQILVIDNCFADIDILRTALTEYGDPYELTILRDGEEALCFVAAHRLRIRPPVPCVIVLDLNLPKHDGLAVLEALKTEPVLSHIGVLLMGNCLDSLALGFIRDMGILCQNKPNDWHDYLDLAAQLIAICKVGRLALRQ